MMTEDAGLPSMQPEVAPHSWTQAWLISLTQPNEMSYTALAEDPSASIRKGFAWVFVSGLIASGVASVLRLAFISTALSGLEQSSDMTTEIGIVALITLACLIPFSAALAGVGLMIYAGIEQFVAGALGGEGSFARLYYVMAAYTAPISLAAALLALIPFLGACVSGLLGFYSLGLNALAIKSVNRFGWGSAVLSMIVPLIFVVLIFVIVFFALVYPALPTLMTQPSG
jgi:hypothetical protein